MLPSAMEKCSLSGCFLESVLSLFVDLCLPCYLRLIDFPMVQTFEDLPEKTGDFV